MSEPSEPKEGIVPLWGGISPDQVGLLSAIYRQFDQMAAYVAAGFQRVEATLSALDDAITQLQTDVSNLTAVDQSAIALINGISAQITAAVSAAAAAGATPEQLASMTALDQSLQAQSSALAAAVAANTPAPTPAPAPAPAPTPTP